MTLTVTGSPPWLGALSSVGVTAAQWNALQLCRWSSGLVQPEMRTECKSCVQRSDNLKQQNQIRRIHSP